MSTASHSVITLCIRAFFSQQRKDKLKIHNQEDYKRWLDMENTGSKLIGFQLQQAASENIFISKPEYFNYWEQGRNKNSHLESWQFFSSL